MANEHLKQIKIHVFILNCGLFYNHNLLIKDRFKHKLNLLFLLSYMYGEILFINILSDTGRGVLLKPYVM